MRAFPLLVLPAAFIMGVLLDQHVLHLGRRAPTAEPVAEPATTNALCHSTGAWGDRVQLDAEMLLHNDTPDEVYCETRIGAIKGYFLMAPHEVKATQGMKDTRCWRSP